jgi:hypothetical protein
VLDPHLYLIHLRFFDYDMVTERLERSQGHAAAMDRRPRGEEAQAWGKIWKPSKRLSKGVATREDAELPDFRKKMVEASSTCMTARSPSSAVAAAKSCTAFPTVSLRSSDIAQRHPMDLNRRPVASLWIGESLHYINQLCLKSHLVMGHPVTLYCTDAVRNVPEGVEVRPASEIMQIDRAIVAETSASFLSNVFRYKMIQKTGAIWIDCDAFCYKPFPDAGAYLRRPRHARGAELRRGRPCPRPAR